MLRIAALVGSVVALGATTALAENPETPLPTDPHVLLGQLDNGVRYAIRQGLTEA